MRIHTNHVAAVDLAIYEATRNLPGVYASTSRHGSRSHAGALELSLEGNGYARNTGRYGAGEPGATWDEWGVIFAAIFAADPDAVAGAVRYPTYAGADDYAHKTGGRFTPDGLPADTHARHTFRDGRCVRCSAVRLHTVA